ncbi:MULTISPECIES: hypothetical protein [unclassified Butyricimonas]|nr:MULTISPECIES: hypothetical protein [unclassified Butyricimonas]
MMEIVLKLLSGSGYRECISGGTMDALDVRNDYRDGNTLYFEAY